MMVSWVVSLISLSDLLLLMYRNATDFYILILHSAPFPNSLMSSSSFLVVSLGFSMYSIMSSEDSFISSFPIWISLIYFSSVIAMARASKATFNKSGESEHPYLIPDLRGYVLSFSSLSMNLTVGLSYIDFIMLR